MNLNKLMEKEIKIKCPQGYKAIFDEKAMKIVFEKETKEAKEFNYTYIKTVEDAYKYLCIKRIDHKNEFLNTFVDLDVILRAIENNDSKPAIGERLYYPYIVIRDIDYTFDDDKRYIKYKIKINSKECFLVGGSVTYGSYIGSGFLHAFDAVSYLSVYLYSRPIRSEEKAKYISRQFCKLIFKVCIQSRVNGKIEFIDD